MVKKKKEKSKQYRDKKKKLGYFPKNYPIYKDNIKLLEKIKEKTGKDIYLIVNDAIKALGESNYMDTLGQISPKPKAENIQTVPKPEETISLDEFEKYKFLVNSLIICYSNARWDADEFRRMTDEIEEIMKNKKYEEIITRTFFNKKIKPKHPDFFENFFEYRLFLNDFT